MFTDSIKNEYLPVNLKPAMSNKAMTASTEA